MGPRKFRFTLTGLMPLIMHADNIEGSDDLKKWRKDPAHKPISVAGDDRSPAWTWHTYCYHDGEYIAMPSENVMVALRKAAGLILVPDAKNGKTFKELSQSGIVIMSEACEFRSNGKQIKWADIVGMRDLQFSEQSAACKKLGFELFVKRARVGSSKHVRVRPRFSQWSVSGEVMVLKDEITDDVFKTMFDFAGKGGLGDWRPSGKTPGPYGQADVVVEKM